MWREDVMAYFARLDENNVVVEVLAVENSVLNDLPYPESEAIGVNFLNGIFNYSKWKQTSYNKNFRFHFASVNYSYDENYDVFLPPKAFPSWTLNTETFLWQASVAYPNDGKEYQWNEETLSWVEFTGT